MKIVPKPLRNVFKNIRKYIYRMNPPPLQPPKFDGSILSPKIISWEETEEFIFPVSSGQVIKVYDGDTFTIASKLPFSDSPIYRFSVRLNGIDAPEMKSKNTEEKICAVFARDALAELVLHKEIILKNIQTEKYGRILADVYLGELCVNHWMIRERHCVKYDGGTKVKPASWKKYRETGVME